MDLREFANRNDEHYKKLREHLLAPKHCSYIDYLKEQERGLSIQLGAAIANVHIAKDLVPAALYRRVDTLELMLTMTQDALEKELNNG